MTQAEKTMLRYQYVLANTGAASGDFLRTINSWHNQIVLLAGGFQQLGSIVGGVLINAFKPFIQALNSVMGAVINFAQVVSDALGAIFGWEYQTGGGVAQDLEMGAGAAQDIEDATGGAADNAKKLNKYIAGWHEVNNMTSDSKDKGSGGAGMSDLEGLGDADGGKWIQKESLWEKYTSDIDSLYELGDYISGVLTDAMNSIDWDKVYESARGFGSGLASFLNGLISPELFGATGRTIAGALNTAIYAALSFGETFDWTNFGESIATGINNFFATFDFGALADTLNIWAQGILDSAIAAVEKIEWGDIGEKIGDFFKELDFTKTLKKVGKLIWEGINAGFEFYEGMFETAPLETALLTLVGVTKVLKSGNVTRFTKSISQSIDTVVTFGKALSGSQTALEAIKETSPKTASVISTLTSAFSNFRFGIENGNFLTGINEGLGTIRNSLTGMDKLVIGAAASFGEFMMVKDSVKDLATGSGNLLVNLAELVGSAGLAGTALYTAFGPAGIAFAAVTGIVAAIMGIGEAINDIDAQRAGEDIAESLTNPGGVPVDELAQSVSNSIASIGDGFEKISEKSSGIDTANEKIEDTWKEIERIEIAMDSGVISVEEGATKLSELFGTLASTAEQKFGSLEMTLLSAYGENGVIPDVFERLGISTENTMKTVLQVNEQAKNKILEITNELKNLDPTNPKYAELKTELAGLVGTTDEVSKAISDYELKIGNTKIDYSGLLADDNTLDSTKLSEFLGNITNSVEEADTNIQIGIAGIKTALTEELNTAKMIGDMETAEEIQAQLSALPEAISLLEGDIKDKAVPVVTAVQVDFLGRIDDEILAAEERWEKMSPFEKWLSGFSTKDEYVQNAVSDFKTNYIDPLTSEIETAYESVGIEGAGFASSAAEDIIDSLFKTTATYSGAGVSAVTVELNEDYQTILNDALSPLIGQVDSSIKGVADGWAESFVSHTGSQKDKIKTAFEGYAAYSNDGFKKKMEELQNNSTPSIMENWATYGIMNPFTIAMGINSPSTVFAEYGKNTVDGFNSGIESNQDSSRGVIGTWVSKITGWFTDLLDINSPSGIFEDFAFFTVEGFNKGIQSEMSSSYGIVGKWAEKIQNSFSVPKLNTYVPQPDFSPTSYDLGKFRSTMQMEMDARMAEQQWEIRKQNELMEQILTELKNKQLVVGDSDIFEANRRETIKFGKRTGHDPYPVYGKTW